ncbi:MAG: OmpA family protein, partial [Alphaproteobacteria bacterium]
PAAAPVAPAKPVPAVPANAIISQPPRTESAAPRVEHRDLHQMPPIISSPPDAKAPPAAQSQSAPAPAAAPVPPVESAPAHDIDYMRESHAAPDAKQPPAPAPAVVSAPVADTVKATPAPTHKIISTPEPAIVSTPVPEPAARVVAAPAAENRPVASPLPDITVVHEADNPEVSEPAPVAQPAPRPRGPRDEPPTLPKSGKPGHSTVDSIPAFAQAARPVPTAEPAPQTSASPPAQFEAASAAAPVTASPAVTAPPEEMSMPVVPTMADLTLAFPGNSSDLTTETQKKLDSVIRQMKDMGEGRLQVRGFATGEDGSKSSARRIALSRALSVRSYLMDKGIKATRVDVRAMGSETERSPLDRVDLIFAR